jgi:hypothetical protein
MEPLQQTVKITDGMLRALVQRLINQIDSMGTTASPAEITNVAKQLEASLTQVQRVHEQLESTLGRVVEHEHATTQATKKAVGQQKESAESALVTDKLSKLAAIFGGPNTGGTVDGNMEGRDSDKAIGRLETKIDELAAKFDGVREVEMPALRLDVQRVYAKVNKPRSSSTTGKVVASTASSGLAGPDLKRKRENEDAGTLLLAQTHAWTEDQEKKLGDLTKLRDVTELVLGRLVPCPDGGLWDTYRIWECFRLLFICGLTYRRGTRLHEFMRVQKVDTWCCVRRVVTEGTNTMNYAGRCELCNIYTGCVQIRRAADEGHPLARYYYVRVVDRP